MGGNRKGVASSSVGKILTLAGAAIAACMALTLSPPNSFSSASFFPPEEAAAQKQHSSLPPVTATLSGTVLDESGAIVPGATATLTDSAGRESRVLSDAFGRFSFQEPSPGNFVLTVSLSGFQTFTRALVLTSDPESRIEVRLKLGEIAEKVTVVGAAPEVETTAATIAPGVLAAKSAPLPLNGRSFVSEEAIRGRAAGSGGFTTNSTGVGAALGSGRIPRTRHGSASEEAANTEAYDIIRDNAFIVVADDPRSTFAADVDTASYSNLRRFLQSGQKPPRDSIRIEELVNYFQYDYAPPTGETPFGVNSEIVSAPWNMKHRLVRVGIKGREVSLQSRPPANLVFLVDVSGSMTSPEKLPLVKQSLRLLVDRLDQRDRVALVAYAGAAGLVLPSTSCADKQAILSAIDRLESGGSTNGGAGIRLAYQVALNHFIRGGTNRLILATDGDFNVGVTSQGD